MPGDITTTVVSPLRPATAYHFRLYAENHLGASAPSDILHAQTDGEVPGGPPLAVTVEPLGARQLLVTWRPPERELWNGDLLGFTIGYQRIEADAGRVIGAGAGDFHTFCLRSKLPHFESTRHMSDDHDHIFIFLTGPISGTTTNIPPANVVATGSGQPHQPPPLLLPSAQPAIVRFDYNYTRVGLAGGSGSDGLADFRLVGLAKYTAYAVTVQAFNVKGDGPASEPMIAHTLEDVPSAAPQLITCVALSAQNLQVTWQQPPRDRLHGVVQGYKVLYEPASLDVEWTEGCETKISTALSTVLHGLQPYTNYSVQVSGRTD